MLLSIVIPAYHCAKELENCLSYLLQGDYSDKDSTETCTCREPEYMREVEIIVVDDGSSDATAEVAERLIEGGHYYNLRVIRQPHKGISAARNRGLLEATGTYLWFVDADDTLQPLCLDPVTQAIRHLDSDLFKMGHLNTTDFRAHKADREATLRVDVSQLFGREKGTLDHTTYLYRRDFLLQNGIRYPEDMTILEDSVMVLQCLRKAKSVYYNPSFIFYCLDGHTTTRGVWNAERRQHFIPSIVRFFSSFKSFTEEADGRLSIVSKQLYDRYLYVYLRVLLVKGCTWRELSDFRNSVQVEHSFFFNQPNLKMRAMRNKSLYHLLHLGIKYIGIPYKRLFH